MNKGDWITLVAPGAVAFYVLLCDNYLKKNVDPVAFCFQQFLTVTLLSLVWMLIFDLPFSIQSASTYGVMVYLTLFAHFCRFIQVSIL